MKYCLYSLVVFLWLFSSCKEELVLSPFIEIGSVTPTTVKEFSDSIVILLAYEDADGDLGFENPDSFALTLQDARLEKPDYYYVPPLAPPNVEVPIRGELRIVVRNTFKLSNGSQEETNYTLRIRDRAGNYSEPVTTSVITITD